MKASGDADGTRPTSPRLVRLLVSDVDGTLVTNDKRLMEATRAAVRRLAAAGIGFTVTSSRPPRGFGSIIRDLDLRLPIGAFNGGTIIRPDLTEIESRHVPPDIARIAIDAFGAAGAAAWVFTDRLWLLREADGNYADLERRTIGMEPTVAADLAPWLDRVGKIVGVSRDPGRLEAAERSLRATLGGHASVAFSQPYYLDVTPTGIDKGAFLTTLSGLLAIPLEAIAAVGDMDNDVPMLRAAGLPIAMGNASAALKERAAFVTASNEEDGVAAAIDGLILGGGGR